MIKFLSWLAGLRPTPSNKRVPFEPDSPSLVSFLPKPPPDVAAAINKDLDRRIAAGLMRRRGSNPPAPPPGIRRGPDCFIKLHNDRPSLVTRLDRNPYARAVVATAAVVVLTVATGAPILPCALSVILCLICVLMFLAEALR